MMKVDIPIFVINLERDIGKKLHMEQLCQKYELSIEFIEAVNGKELSKEKLKQIYNKELILHNKL